MVGNQTTDSVTSSTVNSTVSRPDQKSSPNSAPVGNSGWQELVKQANSININQSSLDAPQARVTVKVVTKSRFSHFSTFDLVIRAALWSRGNVIYANAADRQSEQNLFKMSLYLVKLLSLCNLQFLLQFRHLIIKLS